MKRRSSGFTLVEVMIALAVLAIAVIGLIATYIWMTRQQAINAETTRATRAAEQAVEQIYGSTRFSEIFPRFNTIFNTAAGADDAGMLDYTTNPYGTATMGTFEVLTDGQIVFDAVPASTPLMFTRPGGVRVGRIEFPDGAVVANKMTLDETACAALGFSGAQCDINGNGVTTDTGLSSYIILPVVVTLTFESIDGTPRTVTYRKVLVSR